MRLFNLLFLFGAIVLFSCDENSDNINPPSNSTPGSGSNDVWAIPQDEIFDGGPGKDGIPAIDDPEMLIVSEATYLTDNELVIGYKSDNDIRAYPHQILDWHEIVNDKVGNDHIAIIYCPLTGTGIGWNREIEQQVTTFGVSGLLYNTNLIPYDRLTDSNWSQMRLDCVQGSLKGKDADIYQVIETTWGTWKEMFPNTLVQSRNTGHSRNYGLYPYGTYKTNNSLLLFPVSVTDPRLPAKERVLGVIIDGKAKAYRFNEFGDQNTGMITDQFNSEDLIIIGSSTRNFMTAFYSRTELGKNISPEEVINDSRFLFSDSEGNKYNIFGEIAEGPDTGQKLDQPVSFMGFWFAWGTFYPELEIYSQP